MKLREIVRERLGTPVVTVVATQILSYLHTRTYMNSSDITLVVVDINVVLTGDLVVQLRPSTFTFVCRRVALCLFCVAV